MNGSDKKRSVLDELLKPVVRAFLRDLGVSTMGKYPKCIGSKLKAGKSMKAAHVACRGSKKKGRR